MKNLKQRIIRKIRNIIQEKDSLLSVKMALMTAKHYGVDGDYFEFGVYAGESFIEAYHWAKNTDDSMMFHAFECFEGLPEPKGIDKGYKSFSKGAYKCTEDQFWKNCTDNYVDMNRVVVYNGLFSDFIYTKEHYERPASVIFIDCDLYASAVDALELCHKHKLIVPGTIIVFHDFRAYHADKDKGEKRAWSEFVKKHKIKYNDFLNGDSFVIRGIK